MRRDEFLKKCNEFNLRLCEMAVKKLSKREIIWNAMDFVMGAEIAAIAEMTCLKGHLDPAYEYQRLQLQDLIRKVKAADFDMDAFECMIAWLEEPDDDGSYPVFEIGRRYLALNNALIYALGQEESAKEKTDAGGKPYGRDSEHDTVMDCMGYRKDDNEDA